MFSIIERFTYLQNILNPSFQGFCSLIINITNIINVLRLQVRSKKIYNKNSCKLYLNRNTFNKTTFAINTIDL